MMDILYKRTDGTFVATVNGDPYHVIPGDPLFEQAEIDGADAPFEPVPPQPTVEEQRAQWSAAAVQIKIALDEIGRLDEVETVVAASSRRTQIAWENATSLRRLSPAMVDLTEGSNPPFTDEQLDDVFQLAMSIEI